MTSRLLWSGLGAIVAAVLTAGFAPASEPLPFRLAADALDGPVAATVERVVDGDTLDVRARIWLGQSLIVRVRIDGVDAPELSARCEEERRMAAVAREYLSRRLAGAEVRLSRVAYDKYAALGSKHT